MAARLRLLILAAALVPIGASCIQRDGSRAAPIPGFQSITPSSEQEIGFEFDRQAQKMLPLVQDVAVLEFIDDLGQMLVAGLGEQPFEYRFRVIVDPSLNAFAVPGGYIYVHTGTLLSVGDVEELAGVMAHELAHVKGHHYARQVKESALPNLLTNLAAIAASAATGQAAPMVAAQGVNVALQLRNSRRFEDEADRVGAVFMTRAGYSPEGMARFFERIQIQSEQMPPGTIPPYLYSHPQVDQRIKVVSALAEELRPVREPPDLGARFEQMQARLAFLLGHKRVSWDVVQPYDSAKTDPLLDRASTLEAGGQPGDALEVLNEAERLEPLDPRVPYRRGTLLEGMGRIEDAIAAYRRAVYLDPGRAAVHLALGRAHQRLGERQKAIFFFEQASWRASAGSRLRAQADREIERLVFPVIAESGFADGSGSDAGDTVAGKSRKEFGPDDPRAAWWGRLGPHYADYHSYVRVRWIDPSGQVVAEEKPHRDRRVLLSSTLRFAGGQPEPGTWRVEVLLGEDVVHADRVTVRAAARPL
jgi:beta-barrel assembly-enhancing protease